MGNVVWKALAFLFIIALMYALRRRGVFPENAHQVVTDIAMKITLPCAIITSFSEYERDMSLFLLVLIGIACNAGMLLLAWLVSRKKEPGERAYRMLAYPGYNIGAFTLPYVQNFFGSAGVIAAVMFDAGNALMCTGGTYAITGAVTRAGQPQPDSPSAGERQPANAHQPAKPHPALRAAVRRLFSSVPFDVYVLLMIVALLGIPIPAPIVTITSTIGAANGFMAMAMIGLMLRIEFKREYFQKVGGVLLVRFVSACALSALFYFCLPFPLVVRQVLAIVVFSPISILTPAFVKGCGGDEGLASFTSSMTILIGLCAITILLLVMHIGG